MDRRVAVACTAQALPFRHDLERACGGWLLAIKHLGNDFVLRAECYGAAFLHRQKEIDASDRARPMRNHDCDSPAGADGENGLGQGGIALGIEVGVGLVENHQERIAIERACERNALCLSRR
jgi:hypothetical protein